jgi:hypothetical protein
LDFGLIVVVGESDIFEMGLNFDYVAFDSTFHFAGTGNSVVMVGLVEYYSYSFAG